MSRPEEGGCAMSQLQCLPSHDLLSEIRRRVHNSRKDTSLPLFGDATADLIAHDCRIITAVLAEDFEAFVVELFEKRMQVAPWPDIRSWDFPGDWISPLTPAAHELLEEDDFVHAYSKSGNYTIKICRKTI
jgi:hypothetical protein